MGHIQFYSSFNTLSEKPETVKNYVAQQLKKDKRVQSVHVGRMGVTVLYHDGTEMQFIPGIKTRNGYRLQKGNRWSNVIYENKFKRELRRTNQKSNGKLYAVIRQVKRDNSHYPNGEKLSGYHIEVLANKIFKNAPNKVFQNEESMLKYYYKRAPQYLQHRITDSTGQSRYVDKTKLGGPHSQNRLRICRRIRRQLRILRGNM